MLPMLDARPLRQPGWSSTGDSASSSCCGGMTGRRHRGWCCWPPGPPGWVPRIMGARPCRSTAGNQPLDDCTGHIETTCESPPAASPTSGRAYYRVRGLWTAYIHTVRMHEWPNLHPPPPTRLECGASPFCCCGLRRQKNGHQPKKSALLLSSRLQAACHATPKHPMGPREVDHGWLAQRISGIQAHTCRGSGDFELLSTLAISVNGWGSFVPLPTRFVFVVDGMRLRSFSRLENATQAIYTAQTLLRGSS